MNKQQTIELLKQQLPGFYSVEQVIKLINDIDVDETSQPSAPLSLTDEQLEMVAGGTDFTVGLAYVGVVAVCCVVAAGVGYLAGKSINTPKQ